jgi:hypothetical protein
MKTRASNLAMPIRLVFCLSILLAAYVMVVGRALGEAAPAQTPGAVSMFLSRRFLKRSRVRETDK